MVDPADGSIVDPFGTAAIRKAVLDSWSASSLRFREDANAEESLTVGGYADRVLIELVANAVDAARLVGESGQVLIRWVESPAGAQLMVANTGAPLTSAGVAGLATLRASAKRDTADTVGHFGVGFTAVLTVTDAPLIVGAAGGVQFDRARTARSIADTESADLHAEVVAREGLVPALRLVWPAPADTPLPPDGFTSEVRLSVREDARAALLELLAGIGPEIFWALPGLADLQVQRPDAPPRRWTRRDEDNGVTVLDDGQRELRFRIGTSTGTIPADLLAHRPVEERRRDRWRISWILPLASPDGPSLGESRSAATFLGAPTPTDEPLSMPAQLVGTFPVDDTRRRLAAAPLTDFLLREAATCYVELVLAVPAADRLALVPAPGFPLSPVDGTVRAEVMAGLADAAMLRTATGEAVAPPDACVVLEIGDEAARLIGQALPGLLAPPHGAAHTEALQALGVRFLPLSAATAALAGLRREPEFWREVYAALEGLDAEQLADLPVPLAAGGQRIGVRGCLLPIPDGIDSELLARAVDLAPTLPVVHPAAAYPLLERLGATPVDADALFNAPTLIQVYREFREALEDEDPDPADLVELARLALDLVAAGGRGDGRLLGDLVLTDSEGEPWPAAELLAPGAPLESVLRPDADLPVVDRQWSEQYSLPTLATAGVRYGVKVMTVDAATGVDADLPDLDQWWEEVIGDGPPPESFTAIADLDLIADEAWPEVLAMISGDREARETLQGAAFTPGLSYTSWWLSRFAMIEGQPPTRWRMSGADDLVGLYDPLPIDVDDAVAASIGVLAGVESALRTDASELLRRYGESSRRVPPRLTKAITPVIAAALRDDPGLDVPDRVRTLRGDAVPAEDVLVLDLPWFAQVVAAAELVPTGGQADLVVEALDLDRASEVIVVDVVCGDSLAVPEDMVSRAAEALGVEALDLKILGAQELSVRMSGQAPKPVIWWAGTDGGLVVDGTAAAVGRAVAWLTGRWADRQVAIAAAAGDDWLIAESADD